jgi:glycosyltransferase involved in cell wall biosynthesis
VRIALVHDYLTQHGGAERVLEALHDLYPDAPVFTSVFEPAALPAEYRQWEVRQSAMRWLPGAASYHRALLPAYPLLFGSLSRQLRDFDVVLADSSAWAHHAHAAPHAAHIVYCHSPARFLHRDQAYLAPARLPGALNAVAPAMFSALRALDRRAARRVDRYVANSKAVATRIKAAYGINADVIYPPVDVERFAPPNSPPPPEDWYLTVSRLVPHKRIDLAVAACTQAGLPLKVIGEGRAQPDLRAIAGPSIEFLGRQDDEVVVDHLRRCRAFILPAKEDFGMTAVEAQAAGRPVVAFGAGGALESVVEGETGLFYRDATPESLLAALRASEGISWNVQRIQANARRFGRARFMREFAATVETAVAAKCSARAYAR